MTGQADALPAARRRKRKNLQRPTPDGPPPRESRSTAIKPAALGPRFRAGWRVIAAKEFADHLSSVRFLVLTIVLALTGAAAVYSTGGVIKGFASQASGTPSLFLILFAPPSSLQQLNQIPPFIDVRHVPRSAARHRLRLRRDQRRAVRGDAAAAARAADLSRRRGQRQVRRRPGRNRARPRGRHVPGRRRRCHPAGHRADGRGRSPSDGVVGARADVHRLLAGPGVAVLGARASGGDVGARRPRGVAAAERVLHARRRLALGSSGTDRTERGAGKCRHDREPADAGNAPAPVAQPAVLRGDGSSPQPDHPDHDAGPRSAPARRTRQSPASCHSIRACSSSGRSSSRSSRRRWSRSASPTSRS